MIEGKFDPFGAKPIPGDEAKIEPEKWSVDYRTSPKPVDDYEAQDTKTYPTSPNPNDPDPFDGLALKKEFEIDDLTWGVANAVSDYSNNKYRQNDLVAQAVNGVAPPQRLTELANERKKLQADREKAAQERSMLGLGQADPTAYNQAQQGYENVIGQAPQAPQMQKAELTDFDKIGALLATIFGGTGMAPQALMGIQAGAQGRADMANKQAQYDYGVAQDQHQNTVKLMAERLRNAGVQLTREEERLLQDFKLKDARLEDQIGTTEKAIDQNIRETGQLSDDLRQQLVNAHKNVDTYMDADGFIETEAERTAIINELAAREQREQLPPGSLTSVMDKYPVGWKSMKRQVNEQKWQNDALRFELDTKKFDEQVRQYEQTYKRQVNRDAIYKAYSEAMLAISQGRLDLAQAQAQFNNDLATRKFDLDTRNTESLIENRGASGGDAGKGATEFFDNVGKAQTSMEELKTKIGIETDPEKKANLQVELKRQNDNLVSFLKNRGLGDFIFKSQFGEVPAFSNDPDVMNGFVDEVAKTDPERANRMRAAMAKYFVPVAGAGAEMTPNGIVVDVPDGALRQPTPEEFAKATPPKGGFAPAPRGGGSKPTNKPKTSQKSAQAPKPTNSKPAPKAPVKTSKGGVKYKL